MDEGQKKALFCQLESLLRESEHSLNQAALQPVAERRKERANLFAFFRLLLSELRKLEHQGLVEMVTSRVELYSRIQGWSGFGFPSATSGEPEKEPLNPEETETEDVRGRPLVTKEKFLGDLLKLLRKADDTLMRYPEVEPHEARDRKTLLVFAMVVVEALKGSRWDELYGESVAETARRLTYSATNLPDEGVEVESTSARLEDRSAQANFARYVKAELEALDVTDAELAKVFDMSRPSVRRWREGGATPPPQMREPIRWALRALGVVSERRKAALLEKKSQEEQRIAELSTEIDGLEKERASLQMRVRYLEDQAAATPESVRQHGIREQALRLIALRRRLGDEKLGPLVDVDLLREAAAAYDAVAETRIPAKLPPPRGTDGKAVMPEPAPKATGVRLTKEALAEMARVPPEVLLCGNECLLHHGETTLVVRPSGVRVTDDGSPLLLEDDGSEWYPFEPIMPDAEKARTYWKAHYKFAVDECFAEDARRVVRLPENQGRTPAGDVTTFAWEGKLAVARVAKSGPFVDCWPPTIELYPITAWAKFRERLRDWALANIPENIVIVEGVPLLRQVASVLKEGA